MTMTERSQAIIRLLVTDKNLNRYQIAEKTGFTPNQVEKALHQLLRHGFISEYAGFSHDVFRLPDTEQSQLEIEGQAWLCRAHARASLPYRLGVGYGKYVGAPFHLTKRAHLIIGAFDS